MTRTLDASIATAVTNNAAGTEILNWLSLLRLDLDSGSVFLNSGTQDFSFDGQTWIGVGGMGSLSGVPENTSLGTAQITATLSHIPLTSLPDFVDEFTNNDPVGRNWKTYIAFLNADFSTKAVLTMDSGFIGSPEMGESAEAGSIALTLLNETTRLALVTFYRMTNQGQQSIWPGDEGFEFVTDTNLAEISWGKTTTTVSSGGGSGGNRPGSSSRFQFRF